MDRSERLAMLERECVKLCEHFSSVQVVAVRQADDGSSDTESYCFGKGSYYERLGATREFLLREDETERVRVRQRENGQ